MTDINQVVEFFRYAAGRSEIIQTFHFGNLSDRNTENLNTVGGVKEYPLLLCTPPTAQRPNLYSKQIYSFSLFLISPYKVLPDSTTDIFHSKQLYFAEMEKTIGDFLTYCEKYTANPFFANTQINYEYLSEGDLIILKTSFDVFVKPDCVISTIDNPTSYTGFAATTANPDELLSMYQK